MRYRGGRAGWSAAPALLLALSLIPDPAAAAAPQIVDPARDGNYLNRQYVDQYFTDVSGQSYVDRDPATIATDAPLPGGNQGEGDILSVRWVTTRAIKIVGGRKVSVVTGFAVTMTLAAPPKQKDRTYTVTSDVGGCGPFVLNFLTTPDFDGFTHTAVLQCPDGFFPAGDSVTVRGNAITWNLPLGRLPRKMRVGTVLSRLRARTVNTTIPCVDVPVRRRRACYAPVIDLTSVTRATYRLGS